MDARARDFETAGAPYRPRSLSRALADLAQAAGPRISLHDLAGALTDRSFGAFMVLMAAPNLLPLPPGSSTVFAVPLILFTAQLVIGRSALWLPGFLGRRSIDANTYADMVRRLEPVLRRLEELVRPRLFALTSPVAKRLIGFLAFLLAVLLALPIPLGNWAPAAAIVAFGIGLTERDGIAITVGVVVAVAAIAIITGVSGAAYALASALFW